MPDDAMSSASEVHVLFIPFLGRSRGLTMVGTAILLARRGGFRCTVVTTPGNTSYIRGSIEHARDAEGLPVDLELVPFPAAEAALPPGVECTDAVPTGDDRFVKLYAGMQLLQRPVEELLGANHRRRPDIMVFDLSLFWYADVARSRSIPYFLLDTLSPFQRAVFGSIRDRRARGLDPAGSATIGPLAGLPHPLEFGRAEIMSAGAFAGMMERLAENESRSCGVLLNSFEELTPEYCNMTAGSCIGPVQLAGGDQDRWVDGAIKKWLDSKRTGSVVYVGFGSESSFSPEQLREIAAGLRGCGHPFVWVVRGGGAELRGLVGDRGLVLTEWAPQQAILNHPATGAFVTHCGWRSTMEAVCAGLPVVAWPLHSEQFINERLLVDILGVGVRILEGPEMRTVDAGRKALVRAGVVGDAVGRLMGGGDEEAAAAREAARRYMRLARSAMAEGGSSYANLSVVIDQMKQLADEKQVVV